MPGSKSKITFPITDGPKLIIRVVVPLPYQWQGALTLLAAKFVRCDDTRNQALASRKVKGFRYFTIDAEYWPTFCPCYRDQIRNAAYRTKITEQICIPFSIRCVDKSSLRDTEIL